MNEERTVTQTDADAEELVAYLDGELEAEDRSRVEKRLADEEAFRSRLRVLQRAWDALDVLGRADADESFTRTTVELVAVKAAEDARQKKSHHVQKRTWGWIGWTLAALVCATGSWLALNHVLKEPNRKLVRDLAVIEHVDEYRNADSVEFLEALDQSGLFAAEVENE